MFCGIFMLLQAFYPPSSPVFLLPMEPKRKAVDSDLVFLAVDDSACFSSQGDAMNYEVLC